MSGIPEALMIISALIDLLQAASRFAPTISAEIQAVSALVNAAKSENRDLTAAEIVAVRALVDGARDRALRAIEAAPQ